MPAAEIYNVQKAEIENHYTNLPALRTHNPRKLRRAGVPKAM